MFVHNLSWKEQLEVFENMMSAMWYKRVREQNLWNWTVSVWYERIKKKAKKRNKRKGQTQHQDKYDEIEEKYDRLENSKSKAIEKYGW